MKPSKYKLSRIKNNKNKAAILYKQGLGLREVGKIIGKSHEWVRLALKELGVEK